MRFEMEHIYFGIKQVFDENTAPDWLTSKNTIPGSTMDYRWFWVGYVLTLEVGEMVKTGFQRITRIE